MPSMINFYWSHVCGVYFSFVHLLQIHGHTTIRSTVSITYPSILYHTSKTNRTLSPLHYQGSDALTSGRNKLTFSICPFVWSKVCNRKTEWTCHRGFNLLLWNTQHWDENFTHSLVALVCLTHKFDACISLLTALVIIEWQALSISRID